MSYRNSRGTLHVTDVALGSDYSLIPINFLVGRGTQATMCKRKLEVSSVEELCAVHVASKNLLKLSKQDYLFTEMFS